jgi:cell division protein FtsL
MTRAPDQLRRGYILLLVLLLLAIIAIAMTAACRAALAQSSRAADAQEDLQRRWGTLTLRVALLPKSESILSRAALSRRLTISLGDQSFDVLISDEQAKLNVNVLQSPERAVTQIIRALGRTDAVRLAPRPTTSQPVFESFSQLFPQSSPADLCSLTTALTCFGDGLLNIRRCSFDSLKYRCGNILNMNELRKLYESCRQGQAAGEAMDQLTLSREKRDRLDAALTDQSTCHSLWIITHTATRSWYYFAVQDQSLDPSQQIFSQEW